MRPDPAQATLPGWCWTCLGRGVVQVAALAIDRHGDRYCVQDELPCPDCAGGPRCPR